MSTEELFQQYEQHFGRADEVIAPNILFDPKLIPLLRAAFDSGTPLTRKIILDEFPEADYEEIG